MNDINFHANKISLGDTVCYYNVLRNLKQKYSSNINLCYDFTILYMYKKIIFNYKNIFNKDNMINVKYISNKTNTNSELFLKQYKQYIYPQQFLKASSNMYNFFSYQKPIILIHALTTNCFKIYDKFHILLQEIRKIFPKITIIAIGNDKNMYSVFNKKLLFYIEKYCDINLINKLSLQELIDLISVSDILLSNDSGPVHLAKCIETKCKIITLMPLYFYSNSLAVYDKIEDPKRIDFIIPEKIYCKYIEKDIIWDEFIKFCCNCVNKCVNKINSKYVIQKILSYINDIYK